MVTGMAPPQSANMVNVDSNNVGSSEVQRTSDHDFKKIIAGEKAKMPPVRSVTGKSIDSIVAYVGILKQ